MKDFKYTKQTELDGLENRLNELDELPKEKLSIQDIEDGIATNEERISNVKAAIDAHRTESAEEYNAHIELMEHEQMDQAKIKALPIVKKYVEGLEMAFEASGDLVNGPGFRAKDFCNESRGKEQSEAVTRLRVAKANLKLLTAHVEQIKAQ